jgi:hypothetical protein
MKPLVIYVAGPFRAKPIPGQDQPNQWEQEQNIRRAEAISLEIWKKGHAAVCPHTNTRYYQGACPDHIWLEGDLAIIERCDGVLLTPDWERSEGARNEKIHAEAHDIPISTDPDELIDMILMKRSGDEVKRLEAKCADMADQIIERQKTIDIQRDQGKAIGQELKKTLLKVEELQARLQDAEVTNGQLRDQMETLRTPNSADASF